MKTSSTPSININKAKSLSRPRLKSNKYNNTTASDSDQFCNGNNMDSTLIPIADIGKVTAIEYQNVTSVRRNSENAILSDSSDRSNKGTNVEKLFPSPGIIIKDIYEIFKANKSARERDSAVLNYINCCFKNKTKISKSFLWILLSLFLYLNLYSKYYSKIVEDSKVNLQKFPT